MVEVLGSGASSTAPRWAPWSALWRGGLLALSIVFVLSTQFLFQFGLYEVWPVSDILLGWLEHLADQLIVGGCIFAGAVAGVVIPARSTAYRLLLLSALITSGAVAGEWMLMLRLPVPPGISAAGVLFAKVARWLVIAGLAGLYFAFERQAAEAAERAHENELRRVQLDQQMTEARLQSLRAQIEPHFLFNTLANVQQLFRTEPDRGRRMLANFVKYLRNALPQMRNDETTLRHEVDLARAYLDVLQVRMGNRLRVSYEIPKELAVLAFPPLALSTLTENAIKHGLNPLPEGGAIEITARSEAGRLSVSVADTGAGLRASGGTGSGLANLRARLAALYGSGASLNVEANAPHGMRVTIVVPARTAPPA
jgi:sensor histidine kinase YesM